MWNKIKAFAAGALIPLFFVPREQTLKSNRLYFLDGFRSVALVLMIASHGLKTWIVPQKLDDFIINLNKVPAPIFFFLVGASYILSRNARLRRGVTREQALLAFSQRSVVLFVLALIYKLMDVLFGMPLQYIRWWEVDVLNIIALSLFLTAILDYLTHRLKKAHRVYLLLALTGVTAAPLMFKIHFPAGFPNLARLYIQGTQAEFAWFTLLPYFGYTLFGAWMVQCFVNGYLEKRFLNLQRVSLILLACMGAGQLINMWAPETVLSECSMSLFYYARAFLMLTLGVYASFLFQRYVGFGPFLIPGAFTMLGYWVHAKIVYLYYKPYVGASDWPMSLWLLFKTCLITFAVIYAWAALKKRYKVKKKAEAPAQA